MNVTGVGSAVHCKPCSKWTPLVGLSVQNSCRRLCGSGLTSLRWTKCNAWSPRQSRQSASIKAVAEVEKPAKTEEVSVVIDNNQDSAYTVVTVEGYNRPGLLSSLSAAFRDLGLDVGKVCIFLHLMALHHTAR